MASAGLAVGAATRGVVQCSEEGSEAAKARAVRNAQRAYADSLRPRQLLIPNDRVGGREDA
jgi:hypothetical protein